MALPVALECVSLAPDDTAAFAGGHDGRIFEVRLACSSGGRAGAGWSALDGHNRAVTCLSFTTDGGLLVSGADAGQV